MLDKMVTGGNAAIPFDGVSVETELIGFRSVDPFEANFGFADCQRVAIHNPGNATDGLQRVSVAEEEERDQNVPEKHRRIYRPDRAITTTSNASGLQLR